METSEMEVEAQHAEQQPAEEQPAEELPAEELPAEEQPAEEQPAEEQPAEELPAEELPAEQQPAEQKPAEQKPAEQKPAQNNGPPKAKKKKKRKQPQHSADIVYSKGNSFLTMPSLSKVLKDVTDTIVGLQYIWEYRSPSKTVQPHYQCKLCSLSRVQHDMVDHVKGWKHSFRYLKKTHPDKVTGEEEDGVKDPGVRKAVKAAAAEVEKAEGRGQIKVILKEPYQVPAFKGLRSAAPRAARPPGQGMGPMGPPPGPRFYDSRFPGEFPHHGGPLHDFSVGDYEEPGYGGYMSRSAFPDRGMNRDPYPDSMDPGRDGYGRGGPMIESPNTMYPDEYQDSFMDRPMSKPMDRSGLMGAGPESNIPAVLKHLDSFRIENESDAQLVLKVTQKLTDVLMEYRLRNVPAASTVSSVSMRSTDFSNRLMGINDQFSGPSRYPDGPQRYFK